ncbi:MAG: type I phosphomannose isomerase catalytic subunit [Paludibacteraceae bacterium]
MYPLKFNPILKDKIWGGFKLQNIYGKNQSRLPNIGESWELSGYKSDTSVVANGTLAGKTLLNLIENFKGELLGNKVYEKYNSEFPLLFKLIDANDDLSIQVHPNDQYARKRHNSFGKTEMWYVLEASDDAYLIIGFNENIEKETYAEAVKNNKLGKLLKKISVKAGDVFFIPAGLVHAIGKGVMVAEIQQSSDATYRIYDYDRKDERGKKRDIHTQLALDVINFSAGKDSKIEYNLIENQTVSLIKCDYFTTNILEFSKTISKDYSKLDSLIVYMCLDGHFEVECQNTTTAVCKGETLMIPASINHLSIKPTDGKSKLLEIYL